MWWEAEPWGCLSYSHHLEDFWRTWDYWPREKSWSNIAMYCSFHHFLWTTWTRKITSVKRRMTGWTFSTGYRFQIFRVKIFRTWIWISARASILFTAQCTLVFVTAVNALEFCKTLKTKLSQDRDTTMDIWPSTTNEPRSACSSDLVRKIPVTECDPLDWSILVARHYCYKYLANPDSAKYQTIWSDKMRGVVSGQSPV